MADLFGNNLANNLVGGAAADNIFGAGGNDILNGAGGNDNIYGDSGNDLLIGGLGADFMYGGEGNDTMNATGGGNDDLFGGIGNDLYIVNKVTDNLVEGVNQGIDTVQSSVSYTLDANVENLVLTGVANINGTGNGLGNQITGNSGNNTLNGLGGNDTITGGGGNDNIAGGDGNDNIAGGLGNDILNGGLGSDRLLFNTAVAAANVDTINSFLVGSDKIVLDKTLFSALETVATAAGAVLLATDFTSINVAAAFEVLVAGNSIDEIVYNRQTGNLFYNPNNAAAGFGAGGGRFATIAGSPDTVSNTDFLVVV
ncbi:calcium-binding protein [Microcoleus sp. herbarium19]|uniref:calcium-binding protein n=1 Tax=unclassified Microcoleus TaxID=2642155 RepID=UPI002FD25EC7